MLCVTIANTQVEMDMLKEMFQHVPLARIEEVSKQHCFNEAVDVLLNVVPQPCPSSKGAVEKESTCSPCVDLPVSVML